MAGFLRRKTQDKPAAKKTIGSPVTLGNRQQAQQRPPSPPPKPVVTPLFAKFASSSNGFDTNANTAPKRQSTMSPSRSSTQSESTVRMVVPTATQSTKNASEQATSSFDSYTINKPFRNVDPLPVIVPTSSTSPPPNRRITSKAAQNMTPSEPSTKRVEQRDINYHAVLASPRQTTVVSDASAFGESMFSSPRKVTTSVRTPKAEAAFSEAKFSSPRKAQNSFRQSLQASPQSSAPDSSTPRSDSQTVEAIPAISQNTTSNVNLNLQSTSPNNVRSSQQGSEVNVYAIMGYSRFYTIFSSSFALLGN